MGLLDRECLAYQGRGDLGIGSYSHAVMPYTGLIVNMIYTTPVLA